MAIDIEADKARIEGRIPVSGEQQTVVNVEALGVIVALGPGYDVACSQKGPVGDAGHRAAAVPVVDQSRPEDLLTNALDDQAFGLRGARKFRGPRGEAVKRCGWQAAILILGLRLIPLAPVMEYLVFRVQADV